MQTVKLNLKYILFKHFFSYPVGIIFFLLIRCIFMGTLHLWATKLKVSKHKGFSVKDFFLR